VLGPEKAAKIERTVWTFDDENYAEELIRYCLSIFEKRRQGCKPEELLSALTFMSERQENCDLLNVQHINPPSASIFLETALNLLKKGMDITHTGFPHPQPWQSR
jgi:hypothetical protein